MFTSTKAKIDFGKKLKLPELFKKNNEKCVFLSKVTPFYSKEMQIPQDATSGPLATLGAFIRAHPKHILKNNNNIEDKVCYQFG